PLSHCDNGWNRGQRRDTQELPDIRKDAHGRIQCVLQENEAGAASKTEKESRGKYEESVRGNRLLRRQRRFNHRETFALALGFQVLRNLNVPLLGADLLIFELRAVQFTR